MLAITENALIKFQRPRLLCLKGTFYDRWLGLYFLCKLHTKKA